MIIVKIMGGLGNQLFGYALYRKFLMLGVDAFVDFSDYAKPVETHIINGLRYYDVCLRECRKTDIIKLSDENYSLVNRVRRKLFGRKKSHVYENRCFEYDDKILRLTDAYLEGYWQSFLYFDDIRNELTKELLLCESLDTKNQKILEKICSVESVSIHVRRGDYLQFNGIYGDICTEQYYLNAIKYIKTYTSNPLFFVFSNEIGWCKKIFSDIENISFVDINDEVHGCCDLELMKHCKHNIIANSSFSWWAAYLNDNPNKIIIAPDKWVNNCKDKDLIPKTWIRMRGN